MELTVIEVKQQRVGTHREESEDKEGNKVVTTTPVYLYDVTCEYGPGKKRVLFDDVGWKPEVGEVLELTPANAKEEAPKKGKK